MFFSCCGSLPELCAHADLNGIVSAASNTQRLAGETVELCDRTHTKGQCIILFAQDMQLTLSNFASTKMDASKFKTIMDLMENDNKMQDTLKTAGELDDMALECVNKSKEMTQAMQQGMNCLPDNVKDDIVETDSETDEERELLVDVKKDIKELDTCTESLKSMNLFTAGSAGTKAFRGLASKGEVSLVLFEKVKDFAGSVARIMEAFVGQTCCAQLGVAFTEAKDMMRCMRLSSLISKLAEAANQLIEAIIRLMRVAWERFEHFIEQFRAAKKIGKFVKNGLNPTNFTAGALVDRAKGALCGSLG